MKKTVRFLTISLMFIMSTSGIMLMAGGSKESNGQKKAGLQVVSTTTMLTDLVEQIGKEHVSVSGLMGPGVDPHLYQASANDVRLLQNADIVVYQGLHLEGRMGDVFQALAQSGKQIIRIEDGIASERLLGWEDELSSFDPHIWFDISLWKDAARYVAQQLGSIDNANRAAYQENLLAYLKELDDLEVYVKERVFEVPSNSRVLVTAHDAFGYFGRAYGFEVRGLQGISTESEAGTADVSQLAQFIAERRLKAIFIESSVPRKNVEALQAAVKARGFDVSIGGELFSDALGNRNDESGTYIGMFKANINTIVNALK